VKHRESTLDDGRIVIHIWEDDGVGGTQYIALLAHGYGEHAHRYDHVAKPLVADGAAVYAPDHYGHGKSQGERALVQDVEHLAADLERTADIAREEHPGLPLVLIGHSMGGLIATHFAQTRGDQLSVLVLSAPAIGRNPEIEALITMDPLPEIPIDPDVLSRDPEVGRAYAEDDLVYHGPFKRETLQAFGVALERIAGGGKLGPYPVLWVHGSDDQLVPIEGARETLEAIRGEHFEQKIYDGARHEVFNETNRDEVIGDVVAFIGRSL
jgi:alpha-beta hydrolase superfamily lysophospholipase